MTPTETTYVHEVRTELHRLLRRHPAHLRHDAVQTEMAMLIAHVADIRRRFPDPLVYARMRSRHAVRAIIRTENVQTGRGSRYRRDKEGNRVEGRDTFSIDAAAPGKDGEPNDTWATLLPSHDTATQPDAVADDLLTRSLLDRVLAPLSPRERHVLYLIDGQGYSVTEVAAMYGLTRETISRLRSRAISTARAFIEPPC